MKDIVKVGPVYYDVTEKPFIEIDGERNYAGSCDRDATEIAILADLSNERKEATFYHELMHAMLFEAGYSLAEHDEELIDRVSKVLHQVIDDNYK
ncbi:hypothetical protein [Enterococcus innesii]|nr:hypothetical protein [Enterococcus innesii]